MSRPGRVDWNRLGRTTDREVRQQIAGDPDTAPELTEDALDRATIVSPDGSRTPYRDRVPRRSPGDLLKPGARAPASGRYEIVRRSGAGTGEERTVEEGRPLPPTPEADQRYRLLAPAAGKAGS
jgi:hypothetical protein